MSSLFSKLFPEFFATTMKQLFWGLFVVGIFLGLITAPFAYDKKRALLSLIVFPAFLTSIGILIISINAIQVRGKILKISYNPYTQKVRLMLWKKNDVEYNLKDVNFALKNLETNKRGARKVLVVNTPDKKYKSFVSSDLDSLLTEIYYKLQKVKHNPTKYKEAVFFALYK